MRLNILIALFAIVLVSGGAFHSQGQEVSGVNSTDLSDIRISSGGVCNLNSPEQVTVSGSNPVTVGQNGSMKLTAGKSIVLLPGTKIKSGGFMYASITSSPKAGKSGKKTAKLVTVEENEKLELQECFRTAALLFSPFPSPSKGHLHKGYPVENTIDQASAPGFMVPQDHQRKVEAPLSTRALNHDMAWVNHYSNISPCKEILPPCRYVLRL